MSTRPNPSRDRYAAPRDSVSIIRPVGSAAIKRGRLPGIPGAVIEIIRRPLGAAERNPGVARERRPDADLFGMTR